MFNVTLKDWAGYYPVLIEWGTKTNPQSAVFLSASSALWYISDRFGLMPNEIKINDKRKAVKA